MNDYSYRGCFDWVAWRAAVAANRVKFLNSIRNKRHGRK